MKSLFFLLLIIALTSCSSGQKLFEITGSDNGRITAKKEKISGIDYLYIEKKISGKQKYYIFYDCECGVANKLALRKGVLADSGIRTLWTGVTDTSRGPLFFNDLVDEKRLNKPIEFMPITEEEINILEEGLNKVDKECCKNPDKPVNKIIGYVRVKLN